MKSTLRQCKGLPEKRFENGSVLFKENESNSVLFILIEGAVEVTKEGEHIATVTEPGSIFGEIAIVCHQPHMATVTAKEPCRFHVITDTDAFIKSYPLIHWEVTRILGERLTRISTRLIEIMKEQEAATAETIHVVYGESFK